MQLYCDVIYANVFKSRIISDCALKSGNHFGFDRVQNFGKRSVQVYFFVLLCYAINTVSAEQFSFETVLS